MNYYEILKVSKHANDKEIKSSYKALVKKYHPDLYLGDKDFAEQKIKEINEAYDVLSNPEKKREYDEYLNPSPQPEITQNYQAGYYYNPSSYSNYETSNENTQTTQVWSLTQFITGKINQLDSKQQLRIFILVFVFILSLFLINLIEMKSYLETGKYPFQTFMKENVSEGNFIDDNKTYDDYYDKDEYTEDYDDEIEEDFDIDAYLYNILEQMQDNFYTEKEYELNENITL